MIVSCRSCSGHGELHRKQATEALRGQDRSQSDRFGLADREIDATSSSDAREGVLVTSRVVKTAVDALRTIRTFGAGIDSSIVLRLAS